MSCRPDSRRQSGNQNQKSSGKGNKYYNKASVCIAAVCFLCWGVMFSRHWTEDVPRAPKKVWEQMSGNDGKFFKGNPDTSAYADMEGIRCYSYLEYEYDAKGRLTSVKTYRPHDYYPDTWCLDEPEVYKYDSRGRVAMQENGSSRRVYTYHEEGYTIEETDSFSGKVDSWIYDEQENLLYSRITRRYAPGYERESVFEYDDRNRRIRTICKIGEREPYVALEAVYDDVSNTSVEKSYASDGVLMEDSICFYDEDGRLTEKFEDEVSQSGGESFGSYYIYDYDMEGNLVFTLMFYESGNLSMNRYVYDDRSRMKEAFYYDGSHLKEFTEQFQRVLTDGSILTIELDEESGDAHSVTHTASDGTLINYFVYDDER